MKMIMYTVMGFIILMVLTSLVWRFSSREWNIPCPVCLHWLIELDNPFIKIHHASVIIEHLDLGPGMKVLDAGSGSGRLTIPLAEKISPQGEVMAVDMQSGMLEIIKKKAELAHLHNIQFLQAAIGEDKLGHSQYDRALLVTVLGEIPDRESALREMFNALKPGGILLVTEIIFDPHFQSRGAVLKWAQKVGFQKKSIIGNRFAYTIQLEKPAD